MERIIKEKNIDLSVGKVLDAVKTITTIRVKMPENEEIYTKTLFLTDKHRAIRSLFDFADEPKRFGWRIDEVRKKRRVCQNSLFNKITPVTHSCSRGDFHILDVLTHLLFF